MSMEEPKIAIACTTYGNADELKRLLWSVVDGVDAIAVIHCQFRNNVVEIPDSEKETTAVIDKIKDYTHTRAPIRKVGFINYRKEHQWTEFQCRNELIKMVTEMNCNYMIIIDSDEYVYNSTEENWNTFRTNLKEIVQKKYNGSFNVFGIWCTRGFEGNMEDWTYYPRIWYKPWEMFYKGGSHYHFINKRDLNRYRDQWWTPAEEIIDGIRLGHDHTLRGEKTLISRAKYHEWLRAEETRISRDVLNRSMGHAFLDGSESPADFPVSPSELEEIREKYYPYIPKVEYFSLLPKQEYQD